LHIFLKEIGEVLLEAKRQAKETIAQANQQVATVHEEMEQRLAVTAVSKFSSLVCLCCIFSSDNCFCKEVIVASLSLNVSLSCLSKQLSEEKMQQRQTSEENLDTAVTLSQKEIGEVLLLYHLTFL
jgi:hypothetical protein